MTGARMNTAIAEQTAATTQTSVDSRRTGTPRSAARSEFSAAARTATP